jgi:hypothetical protein
MLGALVLLAAIMFGLDLFAGKPENKEREIDVPTKSVPLEAEVQFKGTPVLDPSFKEKIVDATDADRRWWQDDVMHYLLLEAANTPAVHTFKRNLLPITPENASLIEKDSKPWRYRYVRFRGELEYIEEVDYEGLYGDHDPPLGRVERGRLRLAGSKGDDAVHVMFITPQPVMWRDTNEPVPHPERHRIVDGWVRGRGIFVKNFVDERGREEVPCFLVVATDVQRDFETVPVESLDDIPFEIIKDDPTKARTEDGRLLLAKEFPRPLYRLVEYAAQRAGPDGAAKRREEKLQPKAIDDKEEYDAILGNPAKHRADYYGGLGAIAVSPYQYGPADITPNDAGVESCLNGWIVTDRNKLIQFVAPAALAGKWPARTRIRWEGYFYKIKLYRARKGTDEMVPMVVLTSLTEVKPPRPNYLPQFVIAGAFILGMLLLLFLVLREDKTKESYRRQFRKRLAESDAASD